MSHMDFLEMTPPMSKLTWLRECKCAQVSACADDDKTLDRTEFFCRATVPPELPDGHMRRRRAANLKVGDLFDLGYGNGFFLPIEKITRKRSGYLQITLAKPNWKAHWPTTKAERTVTLGPRTLPWVWVPRDV